MICCYLVYSLRNLGSKIAENIIIRYATRVHNIPNGFLIEEFDALKDPQDCETLNVQVIADFATFTYYRDEKKNRSYVGNSYLHMP